MRRFRYALFAGWLALVFSSHAQADDSFVLPPDNPGDTGAVSLGLVPAPAKDSTAAPASTDQANAPQSIDLPTLDPGETSSSPPVPAWSTPTSPGYNKAPSAPGAVVPPKNGTRIITLPTPSQAQSLPSLPGAKNDNSSFDISVAPDSTLGDQDILTIQHNLGITSEQIKRYCHVALSGMITSDKNEFAPIAMNPDLMKKSVSLTGKITNLRLMAIAFCDAIPLADNLGIVTQIGDKYSVVLQQISCKSPTTVVHTLNFKYSGNGKAECTYQ